MVRMYEPNSGGKGLCGFCLLICRLCIVPWRRLWRGWTCTSCQLLLAQFRIVYFVLCK